MNRQFLVCTLVSLLFVFMVVPISSAQVDTLHAAFRGLERFDGPYSMHLKDHYLVTSMDFGGDPIFATFDISGDDPELVATNERQCESVQYDQYVVRLNDRLYQSAREYGYWDYEDLLGLSVLDISDPLHPVETVYPDAPDMGELFGGTGSTVYGFVEDDDRSYIVAWDISDPSSPDSLASTPEHLSRFADNVVCDGFIAVVDEFQLRTYDATTLDLLGTLIFPTYQWARGGIAYANGHIYVAVDENYLGLEGNAPALEVINVEDPSSPFFLDPLLLEERINDIWEDNGALHGELYWYDYFRINIDDPGNPFVELIPDPNDPAYYLSALDTENDFVVHNGKIYTLFGANINSRNLVDFSLIGQFSYTRFAHSNPGITLVNGHLYVPGSESERFVVADLSDPVHPVEVGEVLLPELDKRAIELVTGGEWLHSYSQEWDYSYQLVTYDVSDPLNPEHVVSRPIKLVSDENQEPVIETLDELFIYAILGYAEIEDDGRLITVRRDTLVVQ